jgi:hypothetical protein
MEEFMSDESTMSQIEVADHMNAADNYDVFDEVVEEGDFEESSDDADLEASSEDTEVEESENAEDNSDIVDEDLEDDVEEDSEDSVEEEKEESEESEESEEQELSPEDSLKELNEKLENGDLEIKLNEEDSVTIKELKNSYMGQKEIARRFSEFDVKSKQLEKDTQEIEGYIDTFASKLKDGDSVGAMQYFGEFAGVPPFMIKEQLIAALKPEIIRREQMSATDIQNEYLHNQNEYLQQQRESDNELRATEQANMELQNSINEIRETHSIDNETWEEAYSYVSENLPEGEQLTPELVQNFVLSERNYTQAASVVESFEGQLENKEQWVDELAAVKENYPHFTDEDLNEVLKSAYESVSKQKTEEKLAKKVEAKKAPTKKQTKTKTKTQVEELADLDPELDDWL